MQKTNKVAKNTIILYVQMAITVLISLYTTRLVLSALGTSDFGLFNIVGGVIAMLMFLSAAMASASQRFMSFSSGQGDIVNQRQIFNISLKMHILIAVIMVVLLEILGFFLFDGILNIAQTRVETAQFIFQCLIVSTFFTIISVPYDAVVIADENMLFVAVIRILEVLLKFLIAIFITYVTQDRLYIYGLLMALIPIVLFFIRQFYGHWQYDEVVINFTKYKNKSLFKKMFGFAGWSFMGSSTSMITNYGQGIVVNIFFGTQVNAAQGISGQVSGQLGAFANIMLRALNPVLAKSEGAGNRDLMLKASMIGSKYSFYLLVFFYVPVMIEMPYVFEFWLKEVPKYAVVFCTLLLVRNLIEQLFLTLSSSIAAVGDIKQYQIISSILNFFPLVITYFFFSISFEPQIMYIIFIGYACLKALIVLFYSKKKCGLSISSFATKVVIPCVFVFASTYLLALIPTYLMEVGFYRFLIVCITSVLSFFSLVWFIGLAQNERSMIRNLFKVILNKINI
jgi:O-antigen/teichoic acid export membrane protein